MNWIFWRSCRCCWFSFRVRLWVSVGLRRNNWHDVNNTGLWFVVNLPLQRVNVVPEGTLCCQHTAATANAARNNKEEGSRQDPLEPKAKAVKYFFQ